MTAVLLSRWTRRILVALLCASPIVTVASLTIWDQCGSSNLAELHDCHLETTGAGTGVAITVVGFVGMAVVAMVKVYSDRVERQRSKGSPGSS